MGGYRAWFYNEWQRPRVIIDTQNRRTRLVNILRIT